MKFSAGIIEVSNTSVKQYPGDDAGNSIVATIKGTGGKGETAQVQGSPGFLGNPIKKTKGIRLKIGNIDIIIAALNYDISMPANPGESKVYSTDEDGVEAGTHYLDNAAVHTFNDGTDNDVALED
jgi:hypothetical protein